MIYQKAGYLILLGLGLSRLATSQELKQINLTIHFKSDNSMLDSADMSKLRRFALRVEKIESITGYADTVGNGSYNLNLSRKRSENVYNYLKSINVKIMNAPKYKGELMIENSTLEECRRVQLEGIGIIKSSSVAKETITKVTEIPLNNIFFLPDRAILAPESIPYIKDIARYLSGVNCRILIIGHVNYQTIKPISDSNSFFKLSEQRAKVIYDIFSEFGIDKSTMAFKGAGNSEPLIADPKSYEEKRINMRVQLFMLPK